MAGGRPKKKKINLNQESLTGLLQEIYNECVDLRRKALSEITERKNRQQADDITDEYQLGKINNESLKIVDNTLDKKLSLAKLQSQIVMNKSNNEESTNQGGLTDDDKKLLREMLKNKSEGDNIEYNID